MRSKNPPKSSPDPLKNRAQKAPREGQDDQKTKKIHRPNEKEGITPQRTPILNEKVGNMAPSWPPISNPNR